MLPKNDPAHGVPHLLPQPTEGDAITAPELVNRYGTYEIQPTGDSENFFPAIAAGTYDCDRLHRLRAALKNHLIKEDVTL